TLVADRSLDVLRGVRGEVRQAAVLQVAPKELHGVEVRRVRREPDDVAARMSGEPGPHELVLVRAPTITEQDEWPADLTGEMAKKPPDLGAPNVALRMQGQRQGDLAAPRRHDQRANAGDLLVRARPHGHRRGRTAPPRSGPHCGSPSGPGAPPGPPSGSSRTAPTSGGGPASSGSRFHRGRRDERRGGGGFFTVAPSTWIHSRTRR